MNPLERPLILRPISRSQTNLKKTVQQSQFFNFESSNVLQCMISYIMLICVEFGTHKKYSIGDSAQRKTLNLYLA